MRLTTGKVSLRHSISARLAMLFVAVAFMLFSLIGLGVYFTMQIEMRIQLRASLDARAEIARLIIEGQNQTSKWPLAQERLAALAPANSGARIYVESADRVISFGKRIDGTRVTADARQYQLVRTPRNAEVLLVKSFTVPSNGERPEVQVSVGQSRVREHDTMRTLGIVLVLLIGAASLAALAISRWTTRLGLSPLTRLSHEAARLGPRDHHLRLETAALPSELLELTKAFNGALQRLDDAYQQLEAFNADVAHELRTPISVMIGQTELALTRRTSSEEQLLALQSNREELEHMRVMISDMLFVARADRGEQAERSQVMCLAQEVRKVFSFLEILLEDAGLSTELSGDASCYVNVAMFGRALTNLLVNAIKHAHSRSTITVHIETLPEYVRLSVTNVGDPIDPGALEKLFDRFFRADAARTNSQQNHGLGLAIVRAIASMHGGQAFYKAAPLGRNVFGFTIAPIGAPR